MFDIGWTELMVIAVVAIVVIGPKDLPRVMRTVGKWTGKMKRMAREFQGQFNEALREAELDSVRKDVEEIGKLDPLGDMKKEISKAGEEIKKGMDVTDVPVTNAPAGDGQAAATAEPPVVAEPAPAEPLAVEPPPAAAPAAAAEAKP